MRLVIQIARENGDVYHARCPALPGCEVLGRTSEEARAKIAQAVRGYLAHLDQVLPRELERKMASA